MAGRRLIWRTLIMESVLQPAASSAAAAAACPACAAMYSGVAPSCDDDAARFRITDSWLWAAIFYGLFYWVLGYGLWVGFLKFIFLGLGVRFLGWGFCMRVVYWLAFVSRYSN